MEPPGCPSPVSPTVAPYPSLRSLGPCGAVSLRCCNRSSVETAFGQQSPNDAGDLVGKSDGDQHLRFRASICASHARLGASRGLACRTTALAPMIRSRRIVRSPRFVTAPSFLLPLVDLCNGVSPSQAAIPPGREAMCGRRQCRNCPRDNRTDAPGSSLTGNAVGSVFERRLISASKRRSASPDR